MNSIQTIELRQLDSNNVQANGDYEIILSKPITVENGDVVQLKSAFIDTVRESDIVINDNLTLNIKSCVYFTSWYNLRDSVDAVDIGGVAYTDSPDFRRYIPYLGIDLGGYPLYQLFLTVNFGLIISKSTPVIPLTFSYVNFFNVLEHITVTLPAFSKGTYTKFSLPLNIIANNAIGVNLVSTSTEYLNSIGIGFAGFTQSDTQDYVYQPFTMTTTIILPKGAYSPIQLSTFISQELSKTGLNVGIESQNMSISKFLFATGDFDVGKASPDGRLNQNGTPALLTEQTIFISDDGEILLEFKPNSTFLIGSSQMGLEFDPNSNRFQWTQIHSNMLDSTAGTDISVRYLKYNFEFGGTVFGVANNGGVYFSGLTAFDSNNNYVPFWENILGFDLNTLIVGTTLLNKDLPFGIANARFNLSNPLSVGLNITDGYYGLDSTIVRGSPASGSPPDYTKPYTWIYRQQVPYYNATGSNEAEVQAGISSTINSTVAILAQQTIDDLLNKFSHYILQTDLGFSNNDFIGVDYNKNINGVISKYYSYGSYCASLESEGAIQYVHNGASMQLSSIRIRLLTSSKTLDVNLGNDNTVIFQLIKQPPVLVSDNKPKV
jgi:hypothetical protein